VPSDPGTLGTPVISGRSRLARGGRLASLEPSLRFAGADMTDQRDQELPRATRRRLIIKAVLRGLVTTTVLVVLYYLLPLDRSWDSDTAVRLLIGLLVFAGVTVWQVKAIARSRYPGLRAAKALGLIIPLYLLLFASTYFVMERASAANFTQPLSRTDALYFSVTVFTTVGFGDIAAKSETARVVLIIQMLADLALLGAGARVLLGAVRRGQQRRSDTGDGDSPAAK
jgi:voltage-gated potassium channel